MLNSQVKEDITEEKNPDTIAIVGFATYRWDDVSINSVELPVQLVCDIVATLEPPC